MNDQTIVAFAGTSMCHSTDPDVRTNSVIRSTDKGKSWAVNPTMNDLLTSMTLGDNNTLYIIGRIKNNHENTVFDSKDGGLSWNKSAIKTPFGSFSKIMNIAPKKLLITGSYLDDTNPRLTSGDNGLNWEKNTGSDFMLGVSHGEKMGLYLSQQKQQYSFSVYETHNNGDSWTNIRTFSSTVNEVKVLSATTALILGRSAGEESASFSYTLDGGKTWTDKALLDNGIAGELIASSFFSSKSGYIVGAKNVLYKMTFKQ
jgi:photosystem II stability/assembly factor-like uncharacterized protein